MARNPPAEADAMHVVLVSTYAYPLALGLRYVSAFLKQAGHQVTVIFMCSKRDTAEADFPRPVLDDLVDRARTAAEFSR